MYTGIVSPGVLEVAGTRPVVRCSLLSDCEIGASVSLNGVCLSVVERDGDACTFDVSEETLSRSTFGALRAGERVNVERPVRAGAEFGGHVVQGHVDGVGTITAITPEADGKRFRISLPSDLGRYVVEKGSIAVDGVALTVTSIDDEAFEVAVIPHTLQVTTFGGAQVGLKVNLEVDILAKYVEKLTTNAHRAS